MTKKRVKEIKEAVRLGNMPTWMASTWDLESICDLAIQKLSEREALRKKAAKRRKMMKRGGGK